jgi:bifunctional NMN adenylyltransferase/nudix hydrolase
MKKYDTLVLIGRFQPVHNAHAQIIYQATQLAKQVIIIVGSANQPRTYKNPWSGHERRMMLQNVCDSMGLDKNVSIRIEENTDTIYNDQAWATRVQAIVAKHTQPTDKIGVIGHSKDDATANYLKMFPQWGREHVALVEILNATHIRELYFKRDANLNFIHSVVPESVETFLRGFKISPAYDQIIREREFTESYKKQFAGLQYAPIFVTVDAVVVCSGHVLMVKRRSEPGKGLWAMPGGFVNATTDKSVQDAMIRELVQSRKQKSLTQLIAAAVAALLLMLSALICQTANYLK